MANLAISNTFSNGTTADASQVNTNFSDIVTYINNVNSGTAYFDTIRFADGSLSAPGLAFLNDTNTGFYRIGADNIGIGTGGVLVASMDANQNTIFGNTASLLMGTTRRGVEILRDGGTANGILLHHASGAAVPNNAIFLSSARGTLAAPTTTQSDDTLGFIFGGGCAVNGSLVFNKGSMRIKATENWSGTANGTNIIFATIPNTTTTLANALILDQDGQSQHVDGTVGRPGISFINNVTAGFYRIGVDNIALSLGGAKILDFNTTAFDPVGTGAVSSGTASNYWGDISYKTLTDRGCLPWCDDGVELADGKIVSDLDAIFSIGKHPSKKTIHGLPMLDYRTFPKKAYKPADIDGTLLPRDENDEPLSGADGIEMTMMFGVMIGAIKEIGKRLAALEKHNGT